MNLLYGLTRRVFIASADGVVKYDYLLDTRNFVPQQVLDVLIVPFPYGLLVGEKLFLGGVAVNREPGVVGSEFMFSSSKIMDVAAVVFLLEVAARTINFGPCLPLVTAEVDMLEICSSHIEG
jgi:hypothetical protein